MKVKKSYFRNLTFFVLLLFTSCSNNDEIKFPADVISRDTMVMLLTDLHLAEARLMIGGGTANTTTIKGAYISRVLADAKVDTARFNRSFTFYSLHPALFNEMYEKVIEEISKRQVNKK